jgi:hypothetical protein
LSRIPRKQVTHEKRNSCPRCSLAILCVWKHFNTNPKYETNETKNSEKKCTTENTRTQNLKMLYHDDTKTNCKLVAFSSWVF